MLAAAATTWPLAQRTQKRRVPFGSWARGLGAIVLLCGYLVFLTIGEVRLGFGFRV